MATDVGQIPVVCTDCGRNVPVVVLYWDDDALMEYVQGGVTWSTFCRRCADSFIARAALEGASDE